MSQRLPLPLPRPVARRPTHPESPSAMVRPTQRPAYPLSCIQFVVHTLRPFRMLAWSAAGAEDQVYLPGMVRSGRGDDSLRGGSCAFLHSDASDRFIAEISAHNQLRRVQGQALNPRADSVRCRTGRILRSSCKFSALSQGTNTDRLVIIFHTVSSQARARAARWIFSHLVRVGRWDSTGLGVR